MYQFNSSKVYADLAEGQYIVLNFVTGAYYSFDQASSAVLKALTEGASAGDIAGRFVSRYGADCGATEKVEAFLNKLLELEILIAGGDSVPEAAVQLDSLHDDTMPELGCEGFNDVADLLLMDPIHEVDEDAGWPNKRSE